MVANLDDLKKRVENYSRNNESKGRGYHFPKDLKNDIVSAFSKYGIPELSRLLEISPSTLHSWKGELRKKKAKKKAGGNTGKIDFVQIPASKGPSLHQQQTVEVKLSNPNDTSMAINLPPGCSKDLCEVIGAFINGGHLS